MCCAFSLPSVDAVHACSELQQHVTRGASPCLPKSCVVILNAFAKDSGEYLANQGGQKRQQGQKKKKVYLIDMKSDQ